MFIGHFAVGFAAKRFAPRSSEAVLLTAPLLADILWPVFLLLGWEQVRIDPGNTRFHAVRFCFLSVVAQFAHAVCLGHGIRRRPPA